LTFAELNKHEFLELYEQNTVDQLAVMLGVNRRTVQQWRARIEAMGDPFLGSIKQGAIAFPGNIGREYNQALEIESERLIVLGDVELPSHDIDTLETVLAVAKKFDVKTLVLNGDFLHLDSFSKFARAQVYKLAFREELDAAFISLQVFLQTFKKIYYLSGNHERRINHATEGNVSIGLFLEQMKDVTYSEYSHLDLKSGGKEWLVCHPRNFSVVPLSVPTRIADTRHCNVLVGHNHRLSLGRDKSGQYYVVDGGHARNEAFTSYKALNVTCHPAWNPGFVLIDKGIPFLIDKENRDFWLSIELPKNGKRSK
jgi:predicted phosphodiesterase